MHEKDGRSEETIGFAFLPPALRYALFSSALLIFISALIAKLNNIQNITIAGRVHFVGLTSYLFQTQDYAWSGIIAVLLVALACVPLPSHPFDYLFQRPRIIALALALFTFLFGVLGSRFVFEGFHLSRDELLADSDASVFRSGWIVAPVEREWEPYVPALAPRFMLPVKGAWGFVSDYLPVHALLRAFVGLFADPNLTSPILAAFAVLATFAVARRLWPDRTDTAVVCTICVASSSQFVITSMTSYAMTAHLAFNMIWLWLYLRNDKIGHVGAISVAFLATGLHQIIFHPLFAFPFVVRLYRNNQYKTALAYTISYLVICIFWITYLQPLLLWQGVKPDVAEAAGSDYFFYRVALVLSNFDWLGADLMLKNLLRFVVWENPLLLVLVFLSFPALRQRSAIAWSLLAGILLTITAMFFILAYQGHGWGYRYLHGLIGSASLLAGYGWLELSRFTAPLLFQRCKTAFLVCFILSFGVFIPARALQARYFVRPYIEAWREIARSPSDVVVVDKSRFLFVEDLIRNDPFLRNKPKVMDLTKLTALDIEHLCSNYKIAFFGFDQAKSFGIIQNDQATAPDDPQRRELKKQLEIRKCI